MLRANLEVGCHYTMQNNYSNQELVYAGFFARLGAHIIDAIMVGIFLLIVHIPLSVIGGLLPEGTLSAHVIFRYSLTAMILYVCKVLYYTLLTCHDGRTFGKRAFNLKVVSQDGTPLTWMNVLYRESVGKFLSGVIIYIGYLMIGVDDKKRALHDQLCDTYVVYEKPIKVVQTVKNVSVNPIQSVPGQEAPVSPVQTPPMQLERGAWVVTKKPMNEPQEGDSQGNDEARGL